MKKPWKIQSILSVLLLIVCLIFISLTIWEIDLNQKKQIAAYQKEQEEIGRMLLSLSIRDYREKGSEADLAQMCESMKAVIQEGYVTSSSSFCYVVLNDQVLFLRDTRSANEIVDLTHEDLMEEYSDTCVITEKELKIDEDVCYLGIITREEYIVGQMGLFALKVHIVVYLILISAFAIALASLMRAKVLKLFSEKVSLENQICSDREAIDELKQQKEELSVVNPTEHRYGIVSQKLVNTIRQTLTERQKKKSLRMNLYFRETSHAAMLGALLERSMNKRYVGYYEEPDSFVLLLLNTGLEEAERYSDFIKERMKNEYGVDEDEFLIEIFYDLGKKLN